MNIQIPDQDVCILQNAGIGTDKLVSIAAKFLSEHYSDPKHVSNGFTEAEESFLVNSGAVGVGRINPEAMADNMLTITGEFSQMVAGAYDQKQTAALLGVSASRIRQRLAEGSLYSIEGLNGRVCPRFQFSASGELPGLSLALKAMDKEVHPILVERFFLSVNPDLESSLLNQCMSPREWLLTGHDPEWLRSIIVEL